MSLITIAVVTTTMPDGATKAILETLNNLTGASKSLAVVESISVHSVKLAFVTDRNQADVVLIITRDLDDTEVLNTTTKPVQLILEDPTAKLTSTQSHYTVVYPSTSSLFEARRVTIPKTLTLLKPIITPDANKKLLVGLNHLLGRMFDDPKAYLTNQASSCVHIDAIKALLTNAVVNGVNMPDGSPGVLVSQASLRETIHYLAKPND